MTPTTAQTIAAAQAGDRDAFARIVGEFERMAYGYAVARLGNREQAQDACQDAFLDAWRHLGQLREPSAFPGWLRRVVAKHCDRATRRRRPLPVAELPEVAAPAPHTSDALVEHEQRAWLRAAINQLPEHERVVVALHTLAGARQREVADFLELPLTTIKKRLHSARTRLARPVPAARSLAPPPVLAERIRLFLALREGAEDEALAVLDRHPGLLEAPERWEDAEALDGGFPLAHLQTPLIVAAARGSVALVEALLTRGATPDGLCGCPNAETALWAAVEAGRVETARCLLTAGAAVDAANDQGLTALHVAAMRGNLDLVELLLANGADPAARSHHGMTPADWALARRHAALAERLLAERDAERDPSAHTTPATPAPSTSETGIKAIELLCPLPDHALVRVHAAAETGVMVLLAELAHQQLAGGGSVVWATWRQSAWSGAELAAAAASSGLGEGLCIVEAGPGEDLVAAALERIDGEPMLVIFEHEGQRAQVDAGLPRLTARAGTTFVVHPWTAVTRGELPAPRLRPPYDVQICTSPAAAAAGIYPAIDAEHSRSRSTPDPVAVQAREAILARGPRGERMAAWLAQPFTVAEHRTGLPGVSVSRADTLAQAAAILAGEPRAGPLPR